MAVTVREVFERHQALFGSVPPIGEPFVCPHCLGPRAEHDLHCYACGRMFIGGHGVPGRAGVHSPPSALRRAAVPMTTTLNRGPWYSMLWNYKRGATAYWPAFAALAFTHLDRHKARVEGELLGGTMTGLAVVPSKRGFTHKTQPLVKALALAPLLRDQLAHALDFIPGSVLSHRDYNPAAFRPVSRDIHGGRLVLIEDAWITGATAVSAAGALLEAGAETVAILPLARVVDSEFWGEAHAYRQAMQQPYDPAAWPR